MIKKPLLSLVMIDREINSSFGLEMLLLLRHQSSEVGRCNLNTLGR